MSVKRKVTMPADVCTAMRPRSVSILGRTYPDRRWDVNLIGAIDAGACGA